MPRRSSLKSFEGARTPQVGAHLRLVASGVVVVHRANGGHAAVVGVSVRVGIVSQQAAVAAGNSEKGPPALPGLLFPAIEDPSGRSVAVLKTLPWPSTGWATATSMLRMKQEARVAEGEDSL